VEVSSRAAACPGCGCPIKKPSVASKGVSFLPGVDKLPPLKKKKNPVVALVVGCLFGCVGTGIYFGTFLDFLVPFVVFLVLTIVGVGVGALPGWLFAGVWGLIRALDSNNRLEDA
jgi:hypothetical protein